MRDGTPAIREYETDEFDEEDPLQPYQLGRYFADEEHSDWLRVSSATKAKALEHLAILENFTSHQVEDPSLAQGFIWESPQSLNWYELGMRNRPCFSTFHMLCLLIYNMLTLTNTLVCFLRSAFPEGKICTDGTYRSQ